MTPFLASIPSPARNVLEIGPLTIHFYGIMIAIGVIVAVVVAKRRYQRFGGSGDIVERVAIWAVVAGIVEEMLGRGLKPTVFPSVNRPDGRALVGRVETEALRKGY
jgi:hypothetical protein